MGFKILLVDDHEIMREGLAALLRKHPDYEIVGQAVPSVAPGQAADYFRKTECFCFTEQKLAAHEEKLMPVIFTVDSDLPEHIKELTLSYTFFNKSSSEETAKVPHNQHMNHKQEI